MNREIKFRVWDKLTEKYIYPDKGYQGHFVIDLNGRFHNLQNGSGGDEYIIQQYTGLKDKNGKEIYEGDVVEHTYNVGCLRLNSGELIRGCIPSSEIIQEKIHQEVKWQGAQFIGIQPKVTIGYVVVDQQPQVVGNIFENPELIKNNA